MTLTQIQDKQIAAELAAIRKHRDHNRRKVIFAARTRSIKAIIGLGFSYQQAKDAVTDAADMVALEMGSAGVDPMERIGQLSRGVGA